MTVGALAWQGALGTDIHAIAPVPTRALHDALRCNVIGSGTRPSAWMSLAELQTTSPAAAATFTPRLAGTTIVASNTVAHDVAVSRGTGTVFFQAGWPTPPALSTFLIDVDLTGVPKTPDFQPISIRVHLHQTIDVLWLTPAELVIRPGNGRDAQQQLTALARFDDGVIGDVTEDVPSWTPSGWSVQGTGGGLSVDARTGRLWTTQDSGWSTVDLDLPAIGSGRPHLASADVGAAPRWSAERALTWLAGPGPDAFADAHNVLFVAEGFTKTPDEEANFAGYIRAVHRRIGAFRPYDKTLTAVNFWSVFVESWAPGPSVLTEHALSMIGAGKAMATAIPPPAPLSGPDPWTLEQLIGVVGLPVPAYERTQPTDATREAHWQTLYGAHVSHAKYGAVAVPPAKMPALQLWKALGERTFLEQAATAFGLCHGSLPEAQAPEPVRAVVLNRRRATVIDLDEFVAGLAYRPGMPIGVWGPRGKDRGLMCFVYRSSRYGGAKSSEYFTTSTGPGDSSGDVMPCTQTGPRWSIDFARPPQGPFHLAANSAALVAHELAHALGLGDEYGGHGTTPAPMSLVADVDANGNLRHDATVTATGSIDMATTPWQVWPRITKAGLTTSLPQVSADDPTIASDQMVVTMAAIQAKQFVDGDVVQLRSRMLVADATAYAATVSEPLSLVADPVGDKVILAGSVLPDPARFPIGSVLIGVLLDEQGYPLPLLSKQVKDHVEMFGAINRAAGATCTVPLFNGAPSENSIMYAKNLPAHLLSPSPPPEHIVGLYDGGHIYNCGVYHPTGICLMRRYVVEVQGQPGGRVPGVTYSFCHVCRYVIADRLDPVVHADIDGSYTTHYPT